MKYITKFSTFLAGLLLGLLCFILIPRAKIKSVSSVTTTNTIYRDVPIPPTPVKSRVKNTPLKLPVGLPYAIHDTLTDSLLIEYPTFYAIDTLRFDSMYVTIRDTGDCFGILHRDATLGGKKEEVYITKTITNTFLKPYPLFTLFGGVQANMLNKNLYEISPTLNLCIKNKFQLGYGYGINYKTQNISILLKLK